MFRSQVLAARRLESVRSIVDRALPLHSDKRLILGSDAGAAAQRS